MLIHKETPMRTNIVLDDELMEEAAKYSASRTKKAVVHEALKAFVEHHRRRNLLEIKGKIAFAEGYDHKRLRK
jgi:Arc/MetJ family transcription regulator